MVFKLKKELYDLVERYVCKCYEGKHNIVFDDSKNLISIYEKDIEEFMMAADDAIIVYGMKDEDYLNELGEQLQWLYDELLFQRQHNN